MLKTKSSYSSIKTDKQFRRQMNKEYKQAILRKGKVNKAIKDEQPQE